MIAKNVSDFTLQKFQEVLESNVIEVLTIASMLKEQVSVLQNNNGKITN